MEKVVVLSVTYIYKHFYEVLDKVIKHEIRVHIKYKGEVCAVLEGV